MPNKNHKLAAIVFTDIVGYTKKMEEDEKRTMQLLQQQREIIFPIVESYGGEVVKEIGDGLLMMFSSAVEAVRFAIAAQTRLKDEELTIRAGIHIGDVIFKEGDVFGSAVNTAARIEPLAPPNGICISDDVRNQLRNKDDIETISIGKKELKGVSEPIEIFQIFIEGVTQKQKANLKFILKDLWQRRVIHILAGYFVGSWILKQAVDALVAKYLLSPHLTDLTWVVLLSLLPSVFLLAYFHGKSSSAKWHKFELIGMPINGVLSILIVIFMFQGKDLGAATESVFIENEDGVKIKRTVLKNEFRKKIALYNFKNLSGDTNLNWMQYTIPTMVEYDLSQDIFIESLSSVRFFDKIMAAGSKDGIGLPITLMKKFADYYHLNYFIDGDFTFEDGEFIFTTRLYESRHGKLISNNSFIGRDIFTLTDEITVKIKENVGSPQSHIDSTYDHPISQIFTSSVKSLEYFSAGNKELLFHNWAKGIEYLEKAVEEDPRFTVGYVSLADIYFRSNQTDKATIAIQAAMDNIINVPERTQFQIKFFHYILEQKPEKAMAVIKMWVELFPYDIEGHSTLAVRYYMGGNISGAISEYKNILKIDPEQYDLLITIGNLYEKIGKPDSSIVYYRKYAEQFRKDYKSYEIIGDHYLNIAEFELAKKYYDDAILLEPSEISLSINVANIESRTGNLVLAKNQLFELLKKSKTKDDSSKVYSSISKLYRKIGKIDTSLKYFDKYIFLIKTIHAPLYVLVQQAFTIGYYIEAGQVERAFKILKKIQSEFEPPLDKVVSFGYLFAYLELEDAENAENEIPGAEQLAKGFGEEMLLDNIYYAWGQIYEIRGEYDKAIENYLMFFENQPTSYALKIYLSRCYRKINDNKTAEKHILEALKHYPFRPKINYEAFLVYQSMNKNDKALEHLYRACDIWKDADPNYEPAKKAKNKLKELVAS